MLPRLGAKYPVTVEVISKPREEYRSAAHAASGLPVAPAIKVGDRIVTEGEDVAEETVEAAVRSHLGIMTS